MRNGTPTTTTEGICGLAIFYGRGGGRVIVGGFAVIISLLHCVQGNPCKIVRRRGHDVTSRYGV